MNPHQTQVFAHRGANREAAENTRPAFDKALAHAIDGIETDVQLSRDDVPVLWHDDDLGKIGLPHRHIGDFEYAQLHGMDVSAHVAPGSPPAGIMRLSAFVAAYRKRCRLLLEIKHPAHETAARRDSKVRQTLDLAGTVAGDDIMVSSFDPASLVIAERYRPGFPLVLNLEAEHLQQHAQHALTEYPFLYGLCLPVATLSEGIVKLLRGQDKRIAVYTCNSDDEIGKALQLGVDILISDWPQQALRMRDA